MGNRVRVSYFLQHRNGFTLDPSVCPPRIRKGGPLDGNDPGPVMVPILEHVDPVRGGYAAVAAGGGGGGLGGGGGGGGFFGAIGAAHLAGGSLAMGGGGGGGMGGMGPAGGMSGIGGGVGGGAGGGAGMSGSGPGGSVVLGGGTAVGGGGVGETPARHRGDAGNPGQENLMAFEPAFGFGAGGGAGGGGGLSPTSMGGAGGHGPGGFQGTGIETQQYELQIRMVDILMVSLQYARALRYEKCLFRCLRLIFYSCAIWIGRDGSVCHRIGLSVYAVGFLACSEKRS